jgi:hypothetical protein
MNDLLHLNRVLNMTIPSKKLMDLFQRDFLHLDDPKPNMKEYQHVDTEKRVVMLVIMTTP